MLPLPLLHKRSKHSFKVFSDSPSIGEAPLRKTCEAEVQTEVILCDSMMNTSITLALSENGDSDEDPLVSYWCDVSSTKAKRLDELREENNKLRAEIAANEKKKREIDEEYARLFIKTTSHLEEGQEEDQDQESADTSSSNPDND